MFFQAATFSVTVGKVSFQRLQNGQRKVGVMLVRSQ